MEGFNRKHEVVEQVLSEVSYVEVIATVAFICVLSIGRELVGRIVLQLH
jgi:hypothetical protein